MASENEIKVAEEAAKALGLDKLTPTVYQDVLQPAARESGQQLLVVAKAVRVALSPLEGLVWGYEQTKAYVSAKVTAKLATKPPEEIKPPDKTIAGPLLMNLAFASDAPHLKELYANLLANAMHVATASRVHPSFVQVIQQLSPPEAQILKSISSTLSRPGVLFVEDVASIPGRATGTAQIDPRQYLYSISTWGPSISANWNELCAESGVSERELAQTYLRNLMRLGLLAETIVTEHQIAVWHTGIPDAELKRQLGLTEYGHAFLNVCVRDDALPNKEDAPK